MLEVALLLILHACAVGCDSVPCEPTSGTDVLEAAFHSYYVGYRGIKVGDKVKGAESYTVVKVISKDFTWLHLEPLKVIVTERKRCTQGVEDEGTEGKQGGRGGREVGGGGGEGGGSSNCSSTVFISFMGTRTPAQLINELWSYDMHNFTIKHNHLKVMKYFWEALEVLKFIDGLKVSPKTRYIITGHSLGGAMGSLFAVLMTVSGDGALWKHPGSRLITFGMPRVGDESYAKVHDLLIPPHKKLRLVHNNDIAPHLPLKLLGFRHESREIWLEESWQIEWYWVRCPVLKWCYVWR